MEKAEDYFEKVLNRNPKCAEAYLGFAMCDAKAHSPREMVFMKNWENKNYQKAKRFADSVLLETLKTLEKEAEEEEKAKIKAEKEAFTRLREKCALAQTLIAVGYKQMGLKPDGTVISTGSLRRDWEDVVAISIGCDWQLGLKSDGMVLSSKDGSCSVSDWKDIVAISAGRGHSLGLKSDGTVVAAGTNEHGECNVSSWMDIVSISAGDTHSLGLKSDGTVMAVGRKYGGQCDVNEWNDIVSISAGTYHSLGLKSDGTVVATGRNYDGICSFSKGEPGKLWIAAVLID